MFRSVNLPDNVLGKLYLHSMPGRREPFHEAAKEISEKGISTVVSLTSLQEIAEKSTDFKKAIDSGDFPVNLISFPIQDFGVPSDPNAFVDLSSNLAQSLQNGERILVHCAAGIGRTGLLAASVLLCLGFDLTKARQLVRDAGSGAETPEQRELLDFVEAKLKQSSVK